MKTTEYIALLLLITGMVALPLALDKIESLATENHQLKQELTEVKNGSN